MTLAQLSDASQAVAAVAVIASLAILILQNHQANVLARAEAMRRQIEGIADISRQLFEVPGLADVWARGTPDLNRLSNEERIRFLSFITYTHRTWEALHREHLRGHLEDDLWRAHAQMLRNVQALGGVKQAWALRKYVFSEVFQKFYEANAIEGVAMDPYGLAPSDDAQQETGHTPA
jgi:hypothetical protein